MSVFPTPNPFRSVPQKGSIISHYEIQGELGRGGMGIVYEARDLRLGRSVAIKLLPEDRTGDARSRQRLLREAQSASALNHPNILTIHDVDHEDDTDFIVMELVRGESLEARIARAPLTPDELIPLATQLASGLQAAHDAGIVHRDIKPANIMVTPAGHLKIMDFGIAQIADATSLTADGRVVGSVAYASPEQARGDKVDARTDIWSFGVVLYEALTGKRPFHGSYLPALLYAVLNEAPEPLQELVPGIPPELVGLIERCMEKDPSDRPGSLTQAVSALERGTVAPPVPNSFPLKWGWMVAGLLAIAMLVFGTDQFMALRTPEGVQPKRVAVLPIRAIGENQVSDELREGLLYSITSQLTGLRDYQDLFSVIPASEILSRADSSSDEGNVPSGADIVITGTIQRVQEVLQLRMEMTDARNSVSLDATSINAMVDNLLAFQDEAAYAIVSMLEPSVSVPAEPRNLPGSTVEPGAYDFYLRGEGYLQRFTSEKDVDAAISLFRLALSEDSTYALAHAGLGESLWRKYHITKDNDWALQAEASAHRALALTGDLSRVQVTLGLIKREQGRFNEAISAFQKAVSLAPNAAETYVELGITYRRMEDWARSEEAFLTSIRLRPDLWTGYNELGRLYYAQGRFEETVTQFQKVIQLAPDNQFGYNNLAVVYERMGEVEASIPWFEKGIAVLQSPMLLRNLGSIYYYDQQDFAKATETYQRAVDENELDYKSWSSLGDAALQSEESPERALDAYEHTVALARESLQVNPSDAAALSAVCEALAALGRETEARVSLRSLKRLPFLDNRNLLSIAITHEILGERDSSVVYVNRALSEGVNPKYVMKAPTLAMLRADERFAAPAQ